jgi:aspartate/methionine/tyrosine aminotransferase
VQNPAGFIALCTAENKLVTGILAERCMHVGADSLSDSSVYCYNSFLGMPLAREAAAYCLARRFLQPNNPSMTPAQALELIKPKHVALAAGAAPILSNLAYMLGEAGEACLIPAPYYAAFETDMHVVAGILPFPIRQANPMQGPTEAELDLAFLQARAKGLNPKFLLLTNPNNPLAVVYRPNILLKAVQWARKRRLHTIVDELYALSTHQVRFRAAPRGRKSLT